MIHVKLGTVVIVCILHVLPGLILELTGSCTWVMIVAGSLQILGGILLVSNAVIPCSRYMAVDGQEQNMVI